MTRQPQPDTALIDELAMLGEAFDVTQSPAELRAICETAVKHAYRTGWHDRGIAQAEEQIQEIDRRIDEAWIERPGDGEEVSIVMEAGSVKEDRPKAKRQKVAK